MASSFGPITDIVPAYVGSARRATVGCANSADALKPANGGKTMTESDDEGAEFVRKLFADRDAVPRDIVPGSGPTAAGYLALNETAGTWVEHFNPGTPVEAPDGSLIAMTAGESQTVYAAPAIVGSAELARVGLTPQDVPNLTVIDTPNNEEKTK